MRPLPRHTTHTPCKPPAICLFSSNTSPSPAPTPSTEWYVPAALSPSHSPSLPPSLSRSHTHTTRYSCVFPTTLPLSTQAGRQAGRQAVSLYPSAFLCMLILLHPSASCPPLSSRLPAYPSNSADQPGRCVAVLVCVCVCVCVCVSGSLPPSVFAVGYLYTNTHRS